MKIFNKIKFKNTKKTICYQSGMTYVELIVVLSIFATMSSIIIFNYNAFQSRIDIKNLSSDIALRIVQTQKYSLSGKLPPMAQQIHITDDWKVSYGVNFDAGNASLDKRKKFLYFTDLDRDGKCGSTCVNYGANGEFLEKIDINKGNSISTIEIFNNSGVSCGFVDRLDVVFVRPDSGARFYTIPDRSPCSLYADITITSSLSTPITSMIRVYASGRIEII